MTPRTSHQAGPVASSLQPTEYGVVRRVGSGLHRRCHGGQLHNGAMDRKAVEQWVADYERLWRTPGTELLYQLFVPDASYLPSPCAEPAEGLPAIARFWEAERRGADETFEMSSVVVAVDGATAVVRVLVSYGAARNK